MVKTEKERREKVGGRERGRRAGADSPCGDRNRRRKRERKEARGRRRSEEKESDGIMRKGNEKDAFG